MVSGDAKCYPTGEIDDMINRKSTENNWISDKASMCIVQENWKMTTMRNVYDVCDLTIIPIHSIANVVGVGRYP